MLAEALAERAGGVGADGSLDGEAQAAEVAQYADLVRQVYTACVRVSPYVPTPVRMPVCMPVFGGPVGWLTRAPPRAVHRCHGLGVPPRASLRARRSRTAV